MALPTTPNAQAPARKRPAWRVRLRSILGNAFLLGAVFFGVQAWQTRDVPTGELPPMAFTLIQPDSQRFTTTLAAWRAQHPGEPVALHVRAQWRPICRTEEGSVTRLVADVAVLSVAMQSGAPEAVARVLAQRRLPWATAVDARGELARALGFKSVPALVVGDVGLINRPRA